MDLVGKILAGRYEIIEEIGKGGMAHVYKARCHFLNRYVAVKVLKEELRDDKEFVQRFNTEAQAAARISNPHVVSIFDVGVENGLYYIVMELVEGITLKEYIADKKVLPWRQAAVFAAQICEGLDAAHKMSVIHRDIKPQNIIMTNGDVLKITDFGIARATTQATTTMANTTIGTVHYLSPEQARGGYTNERTDIYSLGVVLYEMLTGRLPFDDNTAVAIAIKHIQEKPILPRILNNDIPKAMEDIVMKALNKEQSARYASAAQFLNDLRAVIKNPNGAAASGTSAKAEDIGATRKHNPIDKSDIEEYRRKKASSEYEEYSKKIDNEMEERNKRGMDRKRAIKEQKKKERRVTIAAIIAAIAAIAVLGLIFTGLSGGDFLGGLFGSADKIEIPNLVDMKYTDAANKYNTQEGFNIIKAETRTDDSEAGTILGQEPAAGTMVTKGSNIVIEVIISAGPSAEGDKVVGDYTDMKLDEVKKKLKEDGFKVSVFERVSDEDKKDIVIDQTPKSGTKVAAGSTISIIVGKGPDDEEDEDIDTSEEDEDRTPSRPADTSDDDDDDRSNNSSSSNNNSSSGGNSTSNTPPAVSDGTSSGGSSGTSSSESSSSGSGSSESSGGSGGSGSTGGSGESSSTGSSESTAPVAPGISN